MAEREKMFAGLVYDPFSEGMPEQRTIAHRLCLRYNQTTEEDEELRNEILDQLMPNRGEGVYLQGPIQFDFGIHTTMGKGSYANFNFTVLVEAKVTIGSSYLSGQMYPCIPQSTLFAGRTGTHFSTKRQVVLPSEKAA